MPVARREGMVCQGKLVSQGKLRACWLPEGPDSPWKLCRRCLFEYVRDHVDELIRTVPTKGLSQESKEYLCHPLFVKELLHVARHQSLFHLLSTLYNTAATKEYLTHIFLPSLAKQHAFTILLQKTCREHHYGSRCTFFRHCIRLDPTLFPKQPLCWSCMAWAARQQDKRIHARLTESLWFIHDPQLATIFETPKKELVDLFVSLELQGFTHGQQHLFQIFMTNQWEDLLLDIWAQGCYQHYIFRKMKWSWAWQTHCSDEGRRAALYSHMKKRCRSVLYSTDEFIARTWHPSRFMAWCLDQEDKADIGYADSDSSTTASWSPDLIR